MLRERGHTQGFTLQPKFTYWESLTPEPPNLIGAVEPHIPQQFEQGLNHDIQFATLPCSVVLTIQLTDRTYVGALLEQFSGSPLRHL